MMAIKPKFWDKKIGFISILLFPLSLIYLLIIFIKKKITIIRKFNTPIICVGNIYVGGTGKTPTSILLANELAKLGKQTSILRKFYEGHIDEYNLIRENFKNLVTCQNRIDGLKKIEKSKSDVIILDDGMQDYKIKKDLSIVCFTSSQQIGNGLVLPSGPLRESLFALKNADIVIINGNKDESFEKKILKFNEKLEIFYSTYKPINIDQFKSKKLLALAGIGNPENFFDLLKKNNLNIEQKLIYPDHYIFKIDEIQNIVNEAERKNYQIIMTEKDYFKIKHFNISKIKYLKVCLVINNQKILLDKIKNIYDKNN
jgi:tetraacyldisaccharide 4'-kinase